MKTKALSHLFLIIAGSISLTFKAEANYEVNVNADDQINYEKLSEGIKANSSIQSLEQALTLVPKNFFNNYVLVYRSRSLQQSSFKHPRAIVFGESGKFIFAFNGDKKQRGFNELEMIQFREDTNRFEFREISFKPGSPPVFSDANPKKCMECHQSPHRVGIDMRPNWEPYNFWPGVYASLNGGIKPVLKGFWDRYKSKESTYLEVPLNKFVLQDFFLVDEQAQEESSLSYFERNIKPLHDRYHFFPAYDVNSPIKLTKITIILNMRRVVRLMRESLSELFDKYKYAIAGLTGGTNSDSRNLPHICNHLYIPNKVKQIHLGALSKIEKINPDDFMEKTDGYDRSFPLGLGIDLIFKPLGVDISDWSMDFKTDGRFSAEDRFTSPHSSQVHLRDAIELLEPNLAELNCDELNDESFKTLNDFEKSGQLTKTLDEIALRPKQPLKPLVNRCIHCHAEGDPTVPYLPFDDFSKLKTMLKDKYPKGTLLDEIRFRTSDHAPKHLQMPPAGQVDRVSRDTFLKSIEDLQ
jgi:hypothetical protein